MFTSLTLLGHGLAVDLEEPLPIPLERLARILAVAIFGRYPIFTEVLVRVDGQEARVGRADAEEVVRVHGGLEAVVGDEQWGVWLSAVVRSAQGIHAGGKDEAGL